MDARSALYRLIILDYVLQEVQRPTEKTAMADTVATMEMLIKEDDRSSAERSGRDVETRDTRMQRRPGDPRDTRRRSSIGDPSDASLSITDSRLEDSRGPRSTDDTMRRVRRERMEQRRGRSRRDQHDSSLSATDPRAIESAPARAPDVRPERRSVDDRRQAHSAASRVPGEHEDDSTRSPRNRQQNTRERLMEIRRRRKALLESHGYSIDMDGSVSDSASIESRRSPRMAKQGDQPDDGYLSDTAANERLRYKGRRSPPPQMLRARRFQGARFSESYELSTSGRGLARGPPRPDGNLSDSQGSQTVGDSASFSATISTVPQRDRISKRPFGTQKVHACLLYTLTITYPFHPSASRLTSLMHRVVCDGEEIDDPASCIRCR